MHSQIDTILLKVASRCNLDCSYCYVYQGQDSTWKQQPKRLDCETISNICENIKNVSTYQETGFAIVLHGGEPLLLGYEKLDEILSNLRRVLPNQKKYPIAIQTNGTLITDKFLDICSLNSVSISISIDGIKSSNDIARFTHDGRSSFDDVLRGINLILSHPNVDTLFSGTLSVIQVSTDPIENYEFLKNLGSKSIDILLQDGNHSFLPEGKSNYHTTEYGQWLSKLFLHYIEDRDPVKIRFFDDLIKIILGGYPDKEGKGSSSFGILVIETNGEIRKNDTLRAAFESADFFTGRPNINDSDSVLLNTIKTQEYIDSTKIQKPSAIKCRECAINHICGGGMPLTRWDEKNGFDNPSVYCEDHKTYINIILNYLSGYGI